MKVIVKETVEHYHVVDLGDNYTIGKFEEDLAKLPPESGLEGIKDLLIELTYYGINSKYQEDGAGKETTLIEVVDEYDE